MLRSTPVTRMLPVIDPERARQFHERRLGLDPRGQSADGSFKDRCAGATGKAAWFEDTEGNFLCIHENLA
ncbi:MAG: hypothetical protein KJZ98_14655 [Burkholderiaceae bacterium]|nr:hypothetical protein [Burkholderiaceae bacterium]MEB2351229.1 hypothetical protein [Burkholderiaceae bacterium]